MRLVSYICVLSVLVGCGRGKAGTVSVETRIPDINHRDGTCLDPKMVTAGIEYTCADGSKRKGEAVGASLAACRHEGEVGCRTTAQYRAVEINEGLASVIKAGARIGTLIGEGPSVCAADGELGCVTHAGFPAVDRSKLAAGNVSTGVTIAGITGTLTSAGPAACATDGEVACVAHAAFAAASTVGLASKVVSGQSVAGVAGNVTLPPAANVRSSSSYGVGGTSLTGALANCGSEGGSDCVVDAATPYRATGTTGLASKVLAGQSVAGVSGNVTLPSAASVLASASYGVAGTGSTGTLATCSVMSRTGCYAGLGWTGVETANLTAANLRSGASVGGVTGDYPSSTNRLAGADMTTDLTSLAAATAAGTYEFFDSAGARYTGAITDTGTITVGTAAQTFNTSLYRQFTVPGDADLVAGKILSGVDILGVSGNVTLPAQADVKLNIQYGVSGTGLTGSYAAVAVSDCTADGQSDCKIPSSGTLKAADTVNFTGWDVRRKRNSAGSLVTFAGLTGLSKTCRNRAGAYDNATAPAAAGLDFFDTIEDYNNNALGLPSQIPAWTMLIGGMTVTAGNDFKCGGIYATGSTNSGNTGADATVAHDADGNWQDLTPGTLPGGASSTNTANGCNATDKHCVFKELISGLMVTELSALAYDWPSALTYCNSLGEAGGAVTSPIPVIGGTSYSDWRLPTQKESMHLYHAGIRGLNQSNDLITTFGDVDTTVWSSSSGSFNPTGDAWFTSLRSGVTDSTNKGNSFPAVCVR